MTSTKDVKNDLDDVSEHVLGSLKSPDRIRLALEAIAADNEDHLEKLRDTAPWKTYRQPEHLFEEGLQQALFLSLGAAYELERGVWLFHRLQGMYHQQLAREFDVSSEGWEFVDEPGPENDYGERPAREQAARFLADYYAWERFASEIFGVGLPTFLSGTVSDGQVELIEEMAPLAAGSGWADLAMDPVDKTSLEEGELGWAGGMTVEVGVEDLPPDEAGEVKATDIAKDWFEDGPAVAVDEPAEPYRGNVL